MTSQSSRQTQPPSCAKSDGRFVYCEAAAWQAQRDKLVEALEVAKIELLWCAGQLKSKPDGSVRRAINLVSTALRDAGEG